MELLSLCFLFGSPTGWTLVVGALYLTVAIGSGRFGLLEELKRLLKLNGKTLSLEKFSKAQWGIGITVLLFLSYHLLHKSTAARNLPYHLLHKSTAGHNCSCLTIFSTKAQNETIPKINSQHEMSRHCSPHPPL